MPHTLTKPQALRLAQLSTLTGRDTARPILEHIEFKFGSDKVTAVATDTYRLAVWRIDDTGGDKFGVVHVNGAAFGDAVKALYKLAPRGVSAVNLDGIEVTPTSESAFDVTGQWEGSPTLTVTGTLDKDWLKWKALFNGQAVLGRERWADKGLYTVPGDTTLPAFSPLYLAGIDKLLGTTVKMREEMGPVRLTHVIKKQGALSPWCFVAKNKDSSLSYLLMPVKVDDQ